MGVVGRGCPRSFTATRAITASIIQFGTGTTITSHESYYAPTTPWSWAYNAFPSLTYSDFLPTPTPGPSSRRAQAPLTTDQV